MEMEKNKLSWCFQSLMSKILQMNTDIYKARQQIIGINIASFLRVVMTAISLSSTDVVSCFYVTRI
jgi:hypothetical protein